MESQTRPRRLIYNCVHSEDEFRDGFLQDLLLQGVVEPHSGSNDIVYCPKCLKRHYPGDELDKIESVVANISKSPMYTLALLGNFASNWKAFRDKPSTERVQHLQLCAEGIGKVLKEDNKKYYAWLNTIQEHCSPLLSHDVHNMVKFSSTDPRSVSTKNIAALWSKFDQASDRFWESVAKTGDESTFPMDLTKACLDLMTTGTTYAAAVLAPPQARHMYPSIVQRWTRGKDLEKRLGECFRLESAMDAAADAARKLRVQLYLLSWSEDGDFIPASTGDLEELAAVVAAVDLIGAKVRALDADKRRLWKAWREATAWLDPAVDAALEKGYIK